MCVGVSFSLIVNAEEVLKEVLKTSSLCSGSGRIACPTPTERGNDHSFPQHQFLWAASPRTGSSLPLVWSWRSLSGHPLVTPQIISEYYLPVLNDNLRSRNPGNVYLGFVVLVFTSTRSDQKAGPNLLGNISWSCFLLYTNPCLCYFNGCEPWEDTYQEGRLVVNWAQIWKQSLAAISTQAPLTQTSLQGEACTGPAACTMFLPAEPALTKVLLE